MTSSLIPILPSEEGGHQSRQRRRQKSNHPAEAEEWLTAALSEADRAYKPEEDSPDLEEHKSAEISSDSVNKEWKILAEELRSSLNDWARKAS